MTARLALALFVMVPAGTAWAGWQVNLPEPSSDIARQIYDLHSLILVVCLGIFVVVFGTMFYTLLRHRKRAGHGARQFHQNTVVEVVWTVIPFLILVGMAWPATRVIVEQKDTAAPELTVKVTGHQWKWEYDYLQDGVKFMSLLATPRDQIENRADKAEHYLQEVDQPLVVPVGKKVRILLTSSDVIHSWWVPALGVKQDAIPGFIRDTWFRASVPGTYRGQCAELCGKDHAFMPIVVEVKAQADYDAWLAGQKVILAAVAAGERSAGPLAASELKARGAKLFAAHCAACHQADGKGIAGAFPALAGSKVVGGAPRAHIEIVLNGKAGTAMAAFKGQLGDAEIAAIITYERTSWGNKASVVQPADVRALRK